MMWEAIGGLLLVAAMMIAALAMFYGAGRDDGYERGRADAYSDVLAGRDDDQGEEAPAAFRAMSADITAPARHRAGQPRASTSPGPAAEPAPDHPGGDTHPTPPAAAGRDGTPRPPVTAVDLAAVFIPEPGTRIPLRAQAAPGKRDADDSGLMPRIQVGPATGAWLAGKRADPVS